MKTYNEYKLELEEIINQMQAEQQSFEEMSALFQKGNCIIDILQQKLTEQQKVLTTIIKE